MTDRQMEVHSSNVQEMELKKYNITLKSVLRVERVFKENHEVKSRCQILLKVEGCMKYPVLNRILNYLREKGRIVENEDGSWTLVNSTNSKTDTF